MKERNIQVKGWGMTLRGPQDYSFNRFDPSLEVYQNFVAHYGDGTGDIYKNWNIKSFEDLIVAKEDYVDLVLADGVNNFY